MPPEDSIQLPDLKTANDFLKCNPTIVQTPIISNAQALLLPKNDDTGSALINLSLKLENTQTTGCFKARGVQMQLNFGNNQNIDRVVAFSSGNYGKALALVLSSAKERELVIAMPLDVSQEKIDTIKNLGASVVLTDHLEKTIDEYITKGFKFLSTLDDVHLISGYASIAFELKEQLEHPPDIIVVPVGGGALLSGIAAGAREVFGENCKVFGCEPDTAGTAFASFRAGTPINLPPNSCSIEKLKPYILRVCAPDAKTLSIMKQFAKDVVQVSDQEVLNTTRLLRDKLDLIVEPLGAAAVAAVIFKKIPDVAGKNVVAIISGGNISLTEFNKMIE